MGELIIATLFLFSSIVLFIQTGGLPNMFFSTLGPSVFPKILLMFMGILSTSLIIIKVMEFTKIKDKKQFIKTFEFSKKMLSKYKLVFIVSLNFFIYIFSMKYIGFSISTFYFIFSTQWWIAQKEKRNLLMMILIAGIITFGSFYFFRYFLNVIFPKGVFFN